MNEIFPVTIVPSDSNLLNGCISLLRILKQEDWNSSSFISVKTNHETAYELYPQTSQISGHPTFIIDGSTITGYSGDVPLESNEFTIKILFKSVKIQPTHYVIQKFLPTKYSPAKWKFYGIDDQNELFQLDEKSNAIAKGSDSLNKFEINSQGNRFSSFLFSIDKETLCSLHEERCLLRIKNIELYGKVYLNSMSQLHSDIYSSLLFSHFLSLFIIKI